MLIKFSRKSEKPGSKGHFAVSVWFLCEVMQFYIPILSKKVYHNLVDDLQGEVSALVQMTVGIFTEVPVNQRIADDDAGCSGSLLSLYRDC